MSRLAVAALEGYQRWVSPFLPGACRFSPSCSEYARLSFLKYGFGTAFAKSGARLLRCHPLHKGGVDLP